MADGGTLRRAAEELARVAVDTSTTTTLAALRDSVGELRSLNSNVGKTLEVANAAANAATAHTDSLKSAIARVEQSHVDSVARLEAAIKAMDTAARRAARVANLGCSGPFEFTKHCAHARMECFKLQVSQREFWIFT